jgi:hypothetical protein
MYRHEYSIVLLTRPDQALCAPYALAINAQRLLVPARAILCQRRCVVAARIQKTAAFASAARALRWRASRLNGGARRSACVATRWFTTTEPRCLVLSRYSTKAVGAASSRTWRSETRLRSPQIPSPQNRTPDEIQRHTERHPRPRLGAFQGRRDVAPGEVPNGQRHEQRARGGARKYEQLLAAHPHRIRA